MHSSKIVKLHLHIDAAWQRVSVILQIQLFSWQWHLVLTLRNLQSTVADKGQIRHQQLQPCSLHWDTH